MSIVVLTMIGWCLNMEIGTFKSPGWDEAIAELMNECDKCDKCGKIPPMIEYKDKNYCTWYCAKKG